MEIDQGEFWCSVVATVLSLVVSISFAYFAATVAGKVLRYMEIENQIEMKKLEKQLKEGQTND